MHDALHSAGGMGEVMLTQDVRLVVKAVVELGELRAQPAHELGGDDVGAGGNGKRQDHAGERSMDARLEQAEPQHQAKRQIGRQAEVAPHVEQNEKPRHHRSGDEPAQMRRVAVEQGDRGDGKKVVGDGER